MKVSIITVCLNSRETIEDAILSVLEQDYQNIEYIIIDGGSTDGTLEIINKYKDRISKIISEPDKGIYDGMNKGLKVATGKIIGFLNSDDMYFSNKVISTVVRTIEQEKVDCCWGDLVYVDKRNTKKIVRYWKSSEYREGGFKRGWMPPHPTFFVKEWVYEKYGGFNTNFSISADYELILRFLEKYKISSFYIPKILVKMRVGGNSNKNLIQILKANVECFNAFRLNGFSVSPFIIFLKPFLKINQFFKR